MTTATDRADVLIEVPTEDTLRILREQQLLPAAGKEIPWTKADARPLPSFAALAQVDPKHTFKSGHFSLSISNAESLFTNEVTGQLHLRSRAGVFTALFVSFAGLGANRKILAYFDVQVFGPGSNSVTIGGTGNPSNSVVSNQATGGQRVSIPYGMTATSDGKAYAFLVPTLTGNSCAWYGTSVYGF